MDLDACRVVNVKRRLGRDVGEGEESEHLALGHEGDDAFAALLSFAQAVSQGGG